MNGYSGIPFVTSLRHPQLIVDSPPPPIPTNLVYLIDILTCSNFQHGGLEYHLRKKLIELNSSPKC
jgi:hypothetical protein